MFEPALMHAAENLLSVSSIMYVADMEEEEDGWIDLYSHEPFESCREILRDVVKAITPFITDNNSRWEFRLFCPDGYLKCLSDGTATDESGEPIPGRNVFSELEGETGGEA